MAPQEGIRIQILPTIYPECEGCAAVTDAAHILASTDASITDVQVVSCRNFAKDDAGVDVYLIGMTTNAGNDFFGNHPSTVKVTSCPGRVQEMLIAHEQERIAHTLRDNTIPGSPTSGVTP